MYSSLRGHQCGVTSLCHATIDRKPILISGDQEGSLVFWDLITLRKFESSHKLCQSQVQSIRSISIAAGESTRNLLVAQSRNHGIHIIEMLRGIEVNILKNYPSYGSLFARCDAILENKTEALLAYPSSDGEQLICVRLLDQSIETISSATVGRPHDKSSVFDIRILELSSSNEKRLVAGYEDGFVCCYSVKRNESHLSVELLVNHDTKFQDFISAFDLAECPTGYIIICGAPKKAIHKLSLDKALSEVISDEIIKLKHQGVSALVTKKDGRLFAAACWNNTIKLFDVDTCAEINTIVNHLDTVQDLKFIPFCLPGYDESQICLFSASLDGTIGIFKID